MPLGYSQWNSHYRLLAQSVAGTENLDQVHPDNVVATPGTALTPTSWLTGPNFATRATTGSCWGFLIERGTGRSVTGFSCSLKHALGTELWNFASKVLTHAVRFSAKQGFGRLAMQAYLPQYYREDQESHFTDGIKLKASQALLNKPSVRRGVQNSVKAYMLGF